MMDDLLVDNLVVFFAVVYYALLVVVYFLRAYERSELELKMSPVFSAQLVLFGLLWARAPPPSASGRAGGRI